MGAAPDCVLLTPAVRTEPVPNWSDDHLIDFAKYRSIFEQIASDKHARGQIDDDGSIVIQAGDR
jgi:hypothetical protein